MDFGPILGPMLVILVILGRFLLDFEKICETMLTFVLFVLFFVTIKQSKRKGQR